MPGPASWLECCRVTSRRQNAAAMVSHPPSRDFAPGYGPRDPSADPDYAGETAWIRAKVGFALVSAITGSAWALAGLWMLVQGRIGRRPLGFLVSIAVAVYMAVIGWWLLFAPLARIAPDKLHVRRALPGSRWHRIDPTRVAWRPGARYVGRTIRALDVDDHPVVIPVWMFRRSNARRLFDWLDAHVVRSGDRDR